VQLMTYLRLCTAAQSFFLWLAGQLVCLPVLFLTHLAAVHPLLADRAHQLAIQIAVITSAVFILHSSHNAALRDTEMALLSQKRLFRNAK